FFFSSRRRHTRSKRDWSSDVCSSDLAIVNFGDYILKRLECLYYSLQRLAMMKKLKIKKCVNSCISRLKKKYPLFLIIVISLVMRSEERRVGKVCVFRYWLYDYEKEVY